MRKLPQGTTYTVMLKVFSSTDHVTPATGKTVAVVLSKAGVAFANPSGGATNATEVGSGWYSVALSATDTNTLGDLVVRGTAAGCDDSEQVCQVVNANTGGAAALPNTACTSNASLLTSGTGAAQLSVSSGNVTLSPTGLDQVTIDGGYTLKQGVQYIAASTAGKVSGAGSGTETFKGLDGGTSRLVVTVDASGNRSAITYG